MNILAIDVGGTTIKYALVSPAGEISQHGKVPTPGDLEEFYHAITEIAKHFESETVEGIAMSCPGAVSDEGIIYGMSALPYIHGPNIKKAIENLTGKKVTIENDANCAALAEVWLGAAKETQDSCFIVCGTGIGGAVIKDRHIHKGAHLHGGEFGYEIAQYNIENDTFSTFSDLSTVQVEKHVAQALNLEPGSLTSKDIFDQEKENPVYAKYVNQFYYQLAVLVYNLQYAYDPEMIVIGGGISVRDDIEDQIMKRVDHILEKVQIAKVRPVVCRCQFGNDANLIGAVYKYLKS